MRSEAKSPAQYVDELPEERRKPMTELRKVIRKNLPKGFEETMCYGMIGYVVPLKTYPAGYHCDPKTPLMFINLGSQKNFIALYHMGIYMDKGLLKWFTDEYKKRVKGKLDMGKSCIRFKKTDDIPYELIGELAAKVTVKDYLERYESILNRKK